MSLLFDHHRLATTFTTLCEIDSPSRGEGRLAQHLIHFFNQFPDIKTIVDDSAHATGSDTGNIVVHLPGAGDLQHEPPLLFCCHLDVIAPCLGVKVERNDDVFSSAGDTVLGSDDKAGIAILMEMYQSLYESSSSHRPLDFLFTTCEEIGLLGAKNFDPKLLRAQHGYALDSTGIDNVIVGAPAAVYIDANITGKAAHAGLNPEHGISSIFLSSQIISRLPLGRLDRDSTANIGVISGGTATNIIPETVHLRGEIRSHSAAKLDKYISFFRDTFYQARLQFAPQATIEFSTPPQYPAMLLTEDNFTYQHARLAGQTLSNRLLDFVIAGGGSDANILNSKGIETAILGIGMDQVHSTSEQISLPDIIRTLELTTALACN